MQIDIPTLNSVAGDSTIYCNENRAYGTFGSSISNVNISLQLDLLYPIAMEIVRRELSALNDIHGNLNDLINSENSEDFELAINMMEAQGIKYSSEILMGIKTEDSYKIMNGIRRYNERNKMNITNMII